MGMCLSVCNFNCVCVGGSLCVCVCDPVGIFVFFVCDSVSEVKCVCVCMIQCVNRNVCVFIDQQG